MITTCTDCGRLYEAGSEEQANERERWCLACCAKRGVAAPGAAGKNGRAGEEPATAAPGRSPARRAKRGRERPKGA